MVTDRAMLVELSAYSTGSGKSKRVSVEKRDFYSLSYRYSGKVLIKNGEKEFISSAGSVTFVPMGVGYETEIIEDARMAIIHFKLNRDIDFRNPCVIDINDDAIQLLFEKIVKEYRVDVPVDFYCISLFYQLLSSLEKLGSSKCEERIPAKIRLAAEYIFQNFSDPTFSVAMLAERLGVSTSYLRREFSAAYNKSPVAFLRDVRIGNAKNLLQSGYLSIGQIAEQCGFSSPSYFIQVFVKFVGDSPERYRRKI